MERKYEKQIHKQNKKVVAKGESCVERIPEINDRNVFLSTKIDKYPGKIQKNSGNYIYIYLNIYKP